MQNLKRKSVLLGTTAIILLSLAGGTAYKVSMAHADTPEAAPPPAPVVTVDVVEQQPLQIWKEYSGRLRAVDFVELRPEVSGSVQEIRFKDGQMVNAGDVLLVINPAPYQAAVAQAEAALQAAQNQADLAAKELVRAQGLIRTEAIALRTLDERRSTASITRSQVEVAKAQLQQAQIDLDRAYVKAPIDGRVSRAELTIGNLVQAGPNAPVLTTIASTDKIYADFEVDEQSYMQNVYSIARNRDEQLKIPVEMVLRNTQAEKFTGTIESFDNHINGTSGTIRARAIFDNSDGKLVPGMFVNVRLGSPTSNQGILITEKAIGTDQDRKFVYVVDQANTVTYREVALGASIDGQRVVTSGLAAGDQLITEGVSKLRPGLTVTTQVASSQ